MGLSKRQLTAFETVKKERAASRARKVKKYKKGFKTISNKVLRFRI